MTQLKEQEGYIDLSNRGVSLFEDHQIPAALEDFWRAFELNPSNPSVLFNLARALDDNQNGDLARHFYLAAVAVGDTDSLFQLGLLSEKIQQKDEAKEFFRGYLKKNPPDDEYKEYARKVVQGGITLLRKNL